MNTRHLQIYAYKEPARFLQDVWEAKKEANPRFTVRSWAQIMGLKAHNPLYEAIRGKRKIPKSYIPLLVRSLGLSPREGLYFEALVDLQRSKTKQEEQYYVDRINELSPKDRIGFLELEIFSFFKDPTHFALIEMTELKGFKYDLGWIQDKLGVKKNIKELKTIFERLISLGFLAEKNGSLVKTQSHIFSQADKHDQALKEYHKKIMSYAAKAIDHQSLEDREYNGICFNIKKENIKKIKSEIRDFKNHLISQYEAKKNTANDTYQFNMQFFNLNKKIDSKETR